MSQRKKSFSAKKKVEILRRHLIDKIPVSDLCDKYGINSVTFYRWQKTFFEKGSTAFENRKKSETRKLESKLSAQAIKLAKKDEIIAEIMESHVDLKKKLGQN